MKKFTTLFLAIALLSGNHAHAQTPGQGANASANAGSDSMAWGVGLGMLAVLGTVVGITVASATSSPSSFSH